LTGSFKVLAWPNSQQVLIKRVDSIAQDGLKCKCGIADEMPVPQGNNKWARIQDL